MDLPEIKALIDAMASSDLAEMEVTKDGWTLRLVRQQPAAGSRRPPAETAPAPPPAAASARSTSSRPSAEDTLVRAPMFGTVYLSPSPGEPAFVETGQAVRAGETLCAIEAMKVFNTVRAERDGTVAAVLVGSGDEVEADQPLLRFE